MPSKAARIRGPSKVHSWVNSNVNFVFHNTSFAFHSKLFAQKLSSALKAEHKRPGVFIKPINSANSRTALCPEIISATEATHPADATIASSSLLGNTEHSFERFAHKAIALHLL